MKRRDVIIEDLHKLRESIGQAHGFDVDRIAATIRRSGQLMKGLPMSSRFFGVMADGIDCVRTQ